MYVSDHRLVLVWFLQTHVTTRYAVKVRWSNYLVLGVGTVGWLELWVNTRSVLYRGIQILSLPWHMISGELVSYVILSCGHVVRPCRLISWFVRPNYVFFKWNIQRVHISGDKKVFPWISIVWGLQLRFHHCQFCWLDSKENEESCQITC